jgi:peroxiredoxin
MASRKIPATLDWDIHLLVTQLGPGSGFSEVYQGCIMLAIKVPINIPFHLNIEGKRMALTYSTMLPLSTKAPDFSLPDVVTGKTVSLAQYKDKKALLVMFICRHCPYVQHIKNELPKLGKDYIPKDVAIVAISSNDAKNYPEDAPESLKQFSQELRLNYSLCYDQSQEVAKAYTAACTPDFFLFDEKRQLVYRGQLDDSRPGNGLPVTGADLRHALDAIVAGKPVTQEQKPSVGCNIKWKN